jgi:hypothetical protein
VLAQGHINNTFAASATFISQTQDSAAGREVVIGNVDFVVTVVESLTTLDVITATGTYFVFIDEEVDGSSAVDAAATFYAAFADTVATSDLVVVAPSIFNAPVIESSRASEVSSASAIFVSIIAEGLAITDTMFSRFLWEPIDDDQTPSWGTINNTQNITWSAVNASQSPGWTDIPTTSTAWTTIDNTQGTVWININIQP